MIVQELIIEFDRVLDSFKFLTKHLSTNFGFQVLYEHKEFGMIVMVKSKSLNKQLAIRLSEYSSVAGVRTPNNGETFTFEELGRLALGDKKC